MIGHICTIAHGIYSLFPEKFSRLLTRCRRLTEENNRRSSPAQGNTRSESDPLGAAGNNGQFSFHVATLSQIHNICMSSDTAQGEIARPTAWNKRQTP
jgi:hypothetical protein